MGAKETIKIFTDGASRGNPGLSGCGAVIYDKDGIEICRIKKFLGIKTNNQAEYEALLIALNKVVKELNPKSIKCFSDSLLLVNQLNGKYKIKSPHLRNFILDIKELVSGVADISFNHIPRGKNVIADSLANEAIDER